jgi:hypothetical protein
VMDIRLFYGNFFNGFVDNKQAIKKVSSVPSFCFLFGENRKLESLTTVVN